VTLRGSGEEAGSGGASMARLPQQSSHRSERARARLAAVWMSAVALMAGSALPVPASDSRAPVAGSPTVRLVTDAPEIRFGDQWRYNAGVVSRAWLDDEGRVELQRGRGIPRMDFPLFVGKLWTSTYHDGSVQTHRGPPITIGNMSIPRLDTLDLFWEDIFDVVAFEQVTTPVGTLDAYRILWITVGSDRSVALTPNALGPDLELQEYRLTGTSP